MQVLEDTADSLGWAHEHDYERRDGGTGESADRVAAQAAVEF